jgi:hypothetical protein
MTRNIHCGFQNYHRYGAKNRCRKDSNMGCLHHWHACYQQTYYRIYDRECFSNAYQITVKDSVYFSKAYHDTVKKLENMIMYYKETAEWGHLIFWPASKKRVDCYTATLEPNRRVSTNEVPLSAVSNLLLIQNCGSSCMLIYRKV